MRLDSHLQGLLDHIVAVLVYQKVIEGLGLHYLLNHQALNIWSGAFKALFDDIR